MKDNFIKFYNYSIKFNQIYFIGFGIFVISLFILYFGFHGDFLLEWFNSYRNPILNHFFIYASKIAEVEGIVAVLVLLLVFRYSSLILSGISLSLATILSNIIKSITDLPRPLEVYDKIDGFIINFVPEVDVHRFMSFPSGHTAAAFAMLFFLLHISKNAYHRLIVLFLSISVALSRVYLFQHFTRDVLAASIIGLLTALFISFIFIHFRCFFELEKRGGLIDLLTKSTK